MLPLLVTAVLSYAVSGYILEVLHMSIDTILLCFCEDLKINKKTKMYFASNELIKFVKGAKPRVQRRHSDSDSSSDDGDRSNPVHGAPGKDGANTKARAAREVSADEVSRRAPTHKL